jgi:hypothetical protein
LKHITKNASQIKPVDERQDNMPNLNRLRVEDFIGQYASKSIDECYYATVNNENH